MRLRPRLSIAGTNPSQSSTENSSNAVASRKNHALRDVSNQGNTSSNNNTSAKSISKRQRNQNSKNEPHKTLSFTDHNAQSHVPEKRRMSARLRAKKEESGMESYAFEGKPKATNIGTQSKRRRTSSLDPKEQPATKKMRTSSTVSKATMRQIGRVAKSRIVTTIECEDQYLVHPDFRLQRESFNGKNLTFGIPKHDRQDSDDVLKNASYATDMFQYLYAAETATRPTLYMSNQNDINAKMRAILVDWLVEVHMKFRLVPETLYLCVNIIDRYCKQVEVKRSSLQLIGVTALLIACKYEEIYPPEVRDCVYITDRAYRSSEVLDMEQDIVHKLAFRITVPTAYPFLQRFCSLVHATDLVKHAASYYTERTLQEHDMLKWRPSVICASALVLALNHPEFAREDGRTLHASRAFLPPILLEYTGFEASDLITCAKEISVKVAEAQVTASRRELIAVKKKYDNRKYLHVSTDFSLPVMPE